MDSAHHVLPDDTIPCQVAVNEEQQTKPNTLEKNTPYMITRSNYHSNIK